MSAMISLTKAQVPSYLFESEFYKNLSADDEDAFDIPQEFFKPDVSIKNAGDLAHLFHTMKFWGLSKLPREIILLLVFKPNSFPADEYELICNVILEFDSEFGLYTLYQNLSKCSWDHQRLGLAILSGKVDLLEHIIQYHMLGGHWDFVMIKSAAENGHLHILKRILDSSKVPIKNPFREVSVTAVASRGHTDCLRFLFEKGCKKQQDTCRAAAENGHLDCLKLAREYGCVWNKTVRNVAASNGHLNCLKYTLEQGCPVDADVACEAAQGGQLECLQYALDQGVKITKRICESAITGGNVECLKLLRARNAPTWPANSATNAAFSGRLACLQYLLDAGCKVNHEVTLVASMAGYESCLELLLERKCEVRRDSVISAAEKGHTACLRVLKKFNVSLGEDIEEVLRSQRFAGYSIVFVRSLHETGYEVPQSTIEEAVGNRNLECVEYIFANKLCTLTAKLMTTAASLYSSRLPMLKILHQYSCPWSVRACKNIADHHDIASLTFIHEQGCPWDEGTTTAAIQLNGLECLMYALKEGCPLGKSACDVAASRGLCNILQLLHERGCPLSLKTCVAAAKKKYVDCLTYAIKHGAPMDESICEAAVTYNGIFWQDSRSERPQTALETLECARGLGCPWDERTCAAAAQHPYDLTCLQYAHENGCPWDVSTTNAAAIICGNPLKTLTYALENGCPCSVDTCLAAAEYDYVGSLQLLREHGCPWDEQVSRAAAKRGGGSCLSYCVKKGCPIDAATMIVYNDMIRFLDAGLDDASY